jgi:predicted alpha/beta-fold hydrolase
MRGHLWTVLPHLVDRVIVPVARGKAWSTTLEDERFGSICISGVLDEIPGARGLVIIVHGMGSSAEVSYVVRAANAARSRGLAVLRLNLRGALQSGEDIYYAGLVEDLKAAIASPEVRGYDELYILGFSLGGHMVMRYALHPAPRVRAVAAVCSPLDLQVSCKHIDSVQQTIYRRHLLTGLKAGASAVESRRGVRLSNTEIPDIQRIREWDDKIVAPRFGFRDADDYYRKASVGPYLGEVAVPSLLVFADSDPMVTARDVRPSLQALPSHSRVRWLAGGHVFFRDNRRVLNELFTWVQSHSEL